MDVLAEVIVGLLALTGTIIGSIMVSQKTVWRIDQLERKVERHNQVVEKVLLLEHDEQTHWKRIDELRELIEQLREEVK